MKADELTVYVIWWRDAESRAGVSRVHASEQRAEEERDLLEAEQPGREYNISEQPVYCRLADEIES
jgi:hypothetical protein